MINSKDRSRLLALANGINTTVFIGKAGLTESVLSQIDEMLTDHELIKIGVQKNADLTAKELINLICEELNAEPVHSIGSKIIIYRYSSKEGIVHIDYSGDSSQKPQEKKNTVEKPKILGRKTFDYKATKKNTNRSGSSTGNNPRSYSPKSNDNKKVGGGRNDKKKGFSSDYAPYKKDGVTIYKHKIGKPASAKKSNKK